MQLDQDPFYKTMLLPWYDSNPVCYFLVFFLIVVLIFAGVGIFVAATKSGYGAYLWFPVMLALLSSFVIVKISFRVVLRNRHS